MPGSFFDTNVLLYLASDDAVKADRAEEIVLRGGAISVQVLNEVANVARRKMQLSWQDTHTFLTTIRALVIVHPVTIETHDAECDTLWSEDLQDGLVIGERLHIANPFHATA